MVSSEGRRSTPRSRLAVRVAVLALVAALGGIAHGVLGTGDDPEQSAAPSGERSTPGSTDESSDPTTSDEDGPTDKDSDGKRPVPDGGVPSGVTGGVGDDVRLGAVDVLAADVPVAGPDIVAAARGRGATSGMVAFAPARGGAVLWRSDRFERLASGDEYGTRSLRTSRGLEARRILWTTLRHRDTGVVVSVINSTLEPGASDGAEAANRAYLQRVRDLVTRLSATSTVVVAGHQGQIRTVSVPAGNVHPGVVVAVREERRTADGVSARVALQSSGTHR